MAPFPPLYVIMYICYYAFMCRILLLDLIRAVSGVPPPTLLSRYMFEQHVKLELLRDKFTEKPVVKVKLRNGGELFSNLSFFGQTSSEIRARAKAAVMASSCGDLTNANENDQHSDLPNENITPGVHANTEVDSASLTENIGVGAGAIAVDTNGDIRSAAHCSTPLSLLTPNSPRPPSTPRTQSRKSSHTHGTRILKASEIINESFEESAKSPTTNGSPVMKKLPTYLESDSSSDSESNRDGDKESDQSEFRLPRQEQRSPSRFPINTTPASERSQGASGGFRGRRSNIPLFAANKIDISRDFLRTIASEWMISMPWKVLLIDMSQVSHP